jgi:hypothetical protein
MLRPPLHPGDPADPTDRLLASIRATLTARSAAGWAVPVRWPRTGLPTRPSAPAREATP